MAPHRAPAPRRSVLVFRSVLVGALALGAVPACGGNGGGAGDGGTDLDDGAAAASCPTGLPVEGAVCDREGLLCAFGDDPRVECRATAYCRALTWHVDLPACAPLPEVTCPDTREAAAGQGCAVQDAYCSYDGVPCHCTNCVEYPASLCGGDPIWQCAEPNLDPGCPAAIPNLGAACEEAGLLCTYGCEVDRSRRCLGGVWIAATAPGGCPL
jgi:hypothetical protein